MKRPNMNPSERFDIEQMLETHRARIADNPRMDEVGRAVAYASMVRTLFANKGRPHRNRTTR